MGKKSNSYKPQIIPVSGRYSVRGYNPLESRKHHLGTVDTIEEGELLHSEWIANLIQKNYNFLPKGITYHTQEKVFILNLYNSIKKETKMFVSNKNLSIVLEARLKLIHSLIEDII
jgi:hypothetical protein